MSKALRQAKKQELENTFAFHLQMRKLGKHFQRQVPCVPGRRFRLDFADPIHKIGIEIQGGVWAPGKQGHNWGLGIEKDHEKLNLCIIHGWRVFQFSDKPAKSGEGADLIEEYYRAQGWIA